MAIDMFTTRTMLAMVEEGQKSNSTWLRDRYFTNRPTFHTQKIDLTSSVAAVARLRPSSTRRLAVSC